MSAVLSSDCTTHSISDSMTRLRFSSAEPLEEETGDCDAEKRRAAVQCAAEEVAAGRRRGRGAGPDEWRARRVSARSGEEEAAPRRRSRAARVAGDMARGFVSLLDSRGSGRTAAACLLELGFWTGLGL